MKILKEITRQGFIFNAEPLTPEDWERDRWGTERWYEFGATMSELFADLDHTVTDNGDGTYTHEFRFTVIDDPRDEVTE